MSVVKMHPSIDIVEKHHVAGKRLVMIALEQAASLENTLRLINSAFNDPDLNPNKDSPIVHHFPDEVNNSIGRLRDVQVDLSAFSKRFAAFKGEVDGN